MASGKESVGARLLESLKFWTVVVIICAIVGTAAYYFGRDYVGQHLHEMEVKQRAPQIEPQVGATAAVADDEDTSENPPVEAIVSVREREPSSREERKARRELEEPQDGAQLNAAEAAAEKDEAEAADAEDEAASGDEDDREQADSGGGGGYVVVAGSFADQENAEKRVQQLAERGYQPFITTQEKDGITYRRVNVGVFPNRDEAASVQEKLTSQGFEAAVWSEG